MSATRLRRQSVGHRAYTLLRFAIKSGGLPSGFSLDERSIQSNFGFSRAAVRDALGRLAHDGLVSRKATVGTTVSSEPIAFPIQDIVPNGDDQIMKYRRLETFTLEGSDYLEMRLGDHRSEVTMCEVVLTVKGEPIGVLTTFSPGAGPSIGVALQGTATMHTLAVEFPLQYGDDVEFGSMDVSIDARVADEDIAEALGIEPGSALLVREQVFRDTEGVIWEYGFAQYRADRVILKSDRIVPRETHANTWVGDFNQAFKRRA